MENFLTAQVYQPMYGEYGVNRVTVKLTDDLTDFINAGRKSAKTLKENFGRWGLPAQSTVNYAIADESVIWIWTDEDDECEMTDKKPYSVGEEPHKVVNDSDAVKNDGVTFHFADEGFTITMYLDDSEEYYTDLIPYDIIKETV